MVLQMIYWPAAPGMDIPSLQTAGFHSVWVPTCIQGGRATNDSNRRSGCRAGIECSDAQIYIETGVLTCHFSHRRRDLGNDPADKVTV